MQRIHPYIRAGYLLHAVSIAEIVSLYLMFGYLYKSGFFNNDAYYFKKILLYPFVVMPLFPQFDAYSRYQNYKQLRDIFYLKGYHSRLIKPFAKSRCQRDAVMAAANDLGFEKNCSGYFKCCGYKWYHFFPDFMISNPKLLVNKQFWVTTFFTKYYQSKVDMHEIRSYRRQNILQLAA